MKRFFLIAIFAMINYITNAQDVIILLNTEEIEAKVTTVTQSQVTYKRWSNLEGPTYTIDKTQIFYIKYQNGEKDIIYTPYNSDIRTHNQLNSTASSPITFRGYANVGTIFTGDGGGPTFDISIGAKIHNYLYAGIETGFHSLFTPYEYYDYVHYYHGEGTIFESYIPIGINLKGFFTKNRKVNPYINCSLGGFLGLGDISGFNGFYFQAGIGMDIKRFTISAGYNGLLEEGRADLGYVKLGIRFGK